ncbi:hypothetical protein [Winogradskyella sp.]|uniref:hypothetical protein n=1 Tax=Winogradskyella sp. TaxID=1883156 RepID=UPI0025E92B0B|nr:hypothetical protein [Winogradskyella sp.]
MQLTKQINDEILTSIKQDFKQKELNLKDLISEVQSDAEFSKNSIEMDIARVRAQMWDGQGIFKNSLRYRLYELDLLIKRNSPLEFYLKDLIDNLSNIGEIDKIEYDRVDSILKKITQDKYKGFVTDIQAIIKKIFKTV